MSSSDTAIIRGSPGASSAGWSRGGRRPRGGGRRGWGAGGWRDLSAGQAEAPHEASLLRLSWEKAANRLGWQPVYGWQEAAAETVDWYKTYHESGPDADMYDACVGQLTRYVDRARELDVAWAS